MNYQYCCDKLPLIVLVKLSTVLEKDDWHLRRLCGLSTAVLPYSYFLILFPCPLQFILVNGSGRTKTDFVSFSIAPRKVCQQQTKINFSLIKLYRRACSPNEMLSSNIEQFTRTFHYLK